MPYASLADLYARFGAEEIDQVADTEGTGSPDMVLIDRVIADADAEIDASLVGRYQLPMAPVPALLVRIACDIARESLFTTAVPENVRERAKTARSLLRSLASGQSRLDGAVLATMPTVDQGLVEIVSGRRDDRHSPFGG